MSRRCSPSSTSGSRLRPYRRRKWTPSRCSIHHSLRRPLPSCRSISKAMAVTATNLDQLYGQLEDLLMRPGWNRREPALRNEPRKAFEPHHWSYQEAKAGLDAAGRWVSTELAERRNLILTNPSATGEYPTSRTLVNAYQMILPGERARSHRHSPHAGRLVLECAEGAYTTVDGVRIDMRPGDVLLTPGLCWHG